MNAHSYQYTVAEEKKRPTQSPNFNRTMCSTENSVCFSNRSAIFETGVYKLSAPNLFLFFFFLNNTHFKHHIASFYVNIHGISGDRKFRNANFKST